MHSLRISQNAALQCFVIYETPKFASITRGSATSFLLLAFVQVPTSAASVNGVQEQRKEVYGEEEDLLVMEVDTEPSIEAEDETYWENEERQNEDEAEDPRDIFYAVKNDSPIEIGGMLSLDPTILDMKGPGGQTPLMHAVLGGHLNAAKYLLSRAPMFLSQKIKGIRQLMGPGSRAATKWWPFWTGTTCR